MRWRPLSAGIGSKLLFVGQLLRLLSMYWRPASRPYRPISPTCSATQFVGAIHGRLLTAWSTAGIIGPVVVNYIREFQLAAGVPRDQLYNTTMYILCGMLIVGLICNYLVKPVDAKWYMSPEDVAKPCRRQARKNAATAPSARSASARAGSSAGGRCSGPLWHSARLGHLDHAEERRRGFF